MSNLLASFAKLDSRKLVRLTSGKAKREAIDAIYKETPNLSYEMDAVLRAFTMNGSSESKLNAYFAHNAWNSQEGLDPLTIKYFGFCHSQISMLHSRQHTALELGYLFGISPFIVATYIYRFGDDYAQALFPPRFLLAPERGAKVCYYNVTGQVYLLELRLHLIAAQKNLLPTTMRKLEAIAWSTDPMRQFILEKELAALGIVGPFFGSHHTVIFSDCPAYKRTIQQKRPKIERYPSTEKISSYYMEPIVEEHVNVPA